MPTTYEAQAQACDLNLHAPKIERAYIDELVQELRTVREAIDILVKKNATEKERALNTKYPFGFCGEIRDALWAWMRRERWPECFARNGIEFRPIYGIVPDPTETNTSQFAFHNAFQIGNYMVDVAQDAVHGSNKIQVHRVKNAPFENFSTYDRFAKVAEGYWGRKVYPNVYFPLLAPFVPLLYEENGRILFEPSHALLVYKDRINRFQGAKKFIFESPEYSQRRIDPEKLAPLDQKPLSGVLSFFNSDFETGQKVTQELWEHTESLPSELWNTHVETHIKILNNHINTLNKTLKEAH